MTRFSERHGYQDADQAPIKVREAAPHQFRGVLIDIAYEAGLTPHTVRTIVCRVLRVRANEQNWSAFPNVDNEVREHLDECAWYEVYDVLEALYAGLASSWGHDSKRETFEGEINKYFRREGIGWQLDNGELEVRGPEGFQCVVKSARDGLEQAQRATAANELHEALADLSRRPKPDVTGAIQHALAALECVARDVTGDDKATLGAILARHPDLAPEPLGQALHKLWGFASEQGRHLKEGREPAHEEAELAVHVAAAVASYLSTKVRTLD